MKKVKLKDVVKDLTEERKILISDNEEIIEPTITSKTHSISPRKFCLGSDLKIKKRVLIKKGDLVFSKLHTQNGSFAFADQEYQSTTTFLPLKILEDKILREFLFNQLHLIVPKLQASDTVGRETYKTRDILGIKINLPPLPEQKQILSKINKVENEIKQLENNIFHDKSLLTKLKKSILQEAVQGKLVPHNPKDESASELLKKIKREKENLIKEGKIKKQKELSAISDDEVPYDLPGGWIWCRFNNLIDFTKKYPMKRGPFGSSIKKSFFVPKDKNTYKVYEQYNAIYNDMNFGRYYINQDKFNELKAFEVDPGDLIISCSGTIGKIGFLPEKIERGIINQALLKICINENILVKRYFSMLFESYIMKTDKLTDLKGTAIKNIPGVDVLKKMPIPLPPLPEQKRIIEKVNALMKLCDELELRVKENKESSEMLMGAVLEEVFA